MTNASTSAEAWERVDPGMIVAVNNLVTDARRVLDSGAGSSWGAEQRRTMEDMLDRVRALMRELARLRGYEDAGDDPRHAELVHRAELLAGVAMLDGQAGHPDALGLPR